VHPAGSVARRTPRFDFLAWFEFAPADREAFEALLGELRRTEEWQYVEREVDVRLLRAA
jgi:hypothetical protein